MSDNTNPPTVTVVPETETSEETPQVKTPNWVQRNVVNPIKSHPKIATAVVGGVALIGSAAFLGRSKPVETTEIYLQLEPVEAEEVEETVESPDTNLA